MTRRDKPTVLVAMSGGVDSSVAAALLHERGYEVIGATLKLWCYEEKAPYARACCSLDAIRDARSLAVRLGFPHYVLDYTELFERQVAQPFLDEYLAGRTPYPCAACNSDLKFGRLLEQARALGADFLASGHYVESRRVPTARGGDEPGLFRAKHLEKDQTYALWSVAREALPHLLFPLGGLTKGEVRAHAARLGFFNLGEKLESQDLCFVGGPGKYADYIAERVGVAAVDRPGPIVDLDGRELGEHRGLVRYTVGQRRGLGVSAEEPQYVVALEPEANRLRVGGAHSLLSREALTGPVHWLSQDPPRTGMRVHVQIRYKHQPGAATLRPAGRDDGELDPDQGVRIVFDEPQRAITPGQSAVFYDGDRLLGGAPLRRDG